MRKQVEVDGGGERPPPSVTGGGGFRPGVNARRY